MDFLTAAGSPLTEFQQNLVVGVVGAVIGVLGAVLVFYLQARRQPQRRLAWDAVTRTTDLVADADLQQHISVSYDGSRVDKLVSVEFAVENTGNRTVKDHQLRFAFPADCRVLEARIFPEPDREKGVVRKSDREVGEHEAVFIVGHLDSGQDVCFRLVVTGQTAEDWKVISHNPEGDVDFRERSATRSKDDSEHFVPFVFLAFLLFTVPPLLSSLLGSLGDVLEAVLRLAFLVAIVPYVLPTARMLRDAIVAWSSERTQHGITVSGSTGIAVLSVDDGAAIQGGVTMTALPSQPPSQQGSL